MKAGRGILMSQINQMTLRVIDKLIAENGTPEFSAAQGRILALLWEEDGLIIQELADRSGLAQNSLTSMVDRLAKNDLCERRADPADRRKSRVFLTEKGKQLKSVFRCVTDSMYGIYYEGFSEEEIRRLDEYHLRIIRNLSKAL